MAIFDTPERVNPALSRVISTDPDDTYNTFNIVFQALYKKKYRTTFKIVFLKKSLSFWERDEMLARVLGKCNSFQLLPE